MPTADNTLKTPFGNWVLHRFPTVKQQRGTTDPLRAWDAADEYILNFLAEDKHAIDGSLLILNDSFGALALSLHHFRPVTISDSFNSRCGLLENLKLNSVPENYVTPAASLEPLQGQFDVVLIKIPRTLALLKHQLCQIQPHTHAESIIIAAGMTRHIHRKTLDLFSRILGPVKTSLAKKKSRLVFCTRDCVLPNVTSPYPDHYFLDVGDQEFIFHNHANVFSRSGLDQGTRFMLEHLPVIHDPVDIIDLGCGNGILGIVAAHQCPQAKLHFVDESYMAIASSRQNMQTIFGNHRECSFEVNYQINPTWSDSVDLVLNNPPFHYHNANNDQIAWKMFSDARRVLKSDGELRIVANRHLGYHAKLKKLFGNCSTIAANAKFVILSSRKSGK